MIERFHISRESKFFISQITLLLALLTSISPFAIDTYIPALPTMSDYFKQPINMLELTVTIYFIGIAVGQLFGGPMSDSFGRKKVAVFGLFLFSVSSICAVFVPDVRVLWVLRFIQAIGGGCASVVNMAIVRDWFEGKQVARMSSLIGMIMMLAPLFAPVIGSFLLIQLGWRSIFIFMFVVSLFTLVLFVLLMPESRDKSAITGKITIKQITGSYIKIFSSVRATLLILSNSFAIAGMFVFITGASFLYIDFFSVEVKYFPLYFGANVIFYSLITFLNYRLVKTFRIISLVKIGLSVQLIAGILLFIAVRQSEPNLWFVFLTIVLTIGSLGLIFPNIIAMVLNQFPEIAGSANAVIGVVRFALSGLMGMILAMFHTGNIIPLGTIIFSCIAVAFTLFFVSRLKIFAVK